MSQDKDRDESTPKRSGRRTFLAGLVTGAGAVAAVAATPRTHAAKPEGKDAPPAETTILYRRTEETARYYRTFYR
jgi:hypothetical protein